MRYAVALHVEGGDEGDGIERAIVHAQPRPRDVEGRRLLSAVRARMFAGGKEQAPVEIGRYRILRRLGQGGMGVVYEAHDPELDRKVALKLVRPGPGGRKERPARLLREAQALALLSHPNVVPIYDAGRHEDQVFLAMGYIEGKTLDRWQVQLRPWSQVVYNYVAAGRGLAAAHAAGLVHRDFKPANVMLADDGRVLVMDFGLVAGQNTSGRVGPDYDVDAVVARLERAKGQPASGVDPAAWEALTRSGQVVGTYSYMAPEQQEGKSADALADQFSFCTAFLEALQGEFPFEGDTPDELYESKQHGRIVQDPPRKDFPKRLRRVLLRGLAAKPEDRWPDLDTLLAEVGRASRRSRLLVAGSVAAVGIAVVGVVGWLAADVSACRGPDALAPVHGPTTGAEVAASLRAVEVAFADPTAEQAERDLDAYADQWSRAYDRACEISADDPEREHRMECLAHRRRALAAAIEVLQDSDEAAVLHAVEVVARLPAVERCSDATYLATAVPWTDSGAPRQRVEEAREQLTRAAALTVVGRLDAAASALETVTTGSTAERSPPLFAELRLREGELGLARGAPEPALESLEQAYYRAMGAGHYEVALEASLHSIGILGQQRGRSIDARAWVRQAQAPITELGNDPYDRARLDRARGELFIREGQFDAAAAALERALEGTKARVGTRHLAVAELSVRLAEAAEGQGRLEEGADLRRQALEVERERLGPQHPAVAATLHGLARTERELGLLDLALDHQRAAVDVLRVVHPRSHVELAAGLVLLGEILREQGELDEAAERVREALSMVEGLSGPNSVEVGEVLLTLAQTLDDGGEHVGAELAERRAEETFSSLPPHDVRRVRLATARARTQSGLGDTRGAVQGLRGILPACATLGATEVACLRARVLLAELLRGADPEGAAALAEQVRRDLQGWPRGDRIVRQRLAALADASSDG